jgi:hypothetical protein
MRKEIWVPVFFALAACSWVPHWACHYYRLETGSSFAVGSWDYSTLDSVVAMFIYTILIALNIISVSYHKIRFVSALFSGIFHLTLAFVHISRVLNPFRFEVFGYEWSIGASVREIIMVFPFGIACIAVAIYTSRLKAIDFKNN